jgi:FKBP-type peptidyl-prolyl cis-trans isomerase
MNYSMNDTNHALHDGSHIDSHVDTNHWLLRSGPFLSFAWFKRRLFLPIACLLLLMLEGCLPSVALDESGELIVEDITVGTGEQVSRDSVAQLNVRMMGRVRDGGIFVNTPATSTDAIAVGVAQLPEGLDLGLRGMRVGGKRRITVPPRLGYGTQQVAGIPPNSTLIYEVELVSLQRLIIEDLVPGTGAQAVLNSFLSVNYIGRLSNNAIFDRSTTPFSFRLGAGSVILGWDYGLLNMRVGGRRRLVVPPALGYGNRMQGMIPPNSTLFFEVELLSVN